MVGIPMDNDEESKSMAANPFGLETFSFGKLVRNFIPVAESDSATISLFSPSWMARSNSTVAEDELTSLAVSSAFTLLWGEGT
jgi:hypothetical protein